MKIGIASDPVGGILKEALISHLQHIGHHVTDFGCSPEAQTDDGRRVLRTVTAVLDQQVATSILISGSGIGACIAANRVPGIRAAMGNNHENVERSRTEYQANVLCLACDQVDAKLACLLIELWLKHGAA